MTNYVAFRPSLAVKEIMQSIPKEAKSRSEWVEYLLLKGFEKYRQEKSLKEAKKSQVDGVMVYPNNTSFSQILIRNEAFEVF
ncbi:hypothetical protein K8R33_02870 [archaeon]|nr:hypothetical protein [archaeon]